MYSPRKFIIMTAVLLGTGAVSCTGKLEDVIPMSDVPVVFSVDEQAFRIETKAFTEATASSLQSGGWRAVALNGSTRVFDEQLSYSSGAYRPSTTYYFPTSGTLSFYGVYPKSQAITVSGSDIYVQYSQNKDTDLVVAKKTGVAKQSGAVSMTFSHALAQLVVRCKSAVAGKVMKVTGVTISAPSSGRYNYPGDSWSNLGSASDYTLYSGSAQISSESYTQVTQPATFIPGAVTVTVTADVCRTNGVKEGTYTQSFSGTLARGELFTLDAELMSSIYEFNGLTGWAGDWTSHAGSYEKEIIFTVNDEGKAVRFAPGNLYWSSSTGYAFEANSWDCPTTYTQDHVGHFTFTAKESLSHLAKPSMSFDTFAADDVLFAANGGAIPGWTVLSSDEWNYLKTKGRIYGSTKTIASKRCLILVPDGVDGGGLSGVSSSITAEQWQELERTYGYVALPQTGYRNGSSTTISMPTSYGRYWCSDGGYSSYPKDSRYIYSEAAYNFSFTTLSGSISVQSKYQGQAIRLVQVL